MHVLHVHACTFEMLILPCNTARGHKTSPNHEMYNVHVFYSKDQRVDNTIHQKKTANPTIQLIYIPFV